jgi:hypothetical protein
MFLVTLAAVVFGRVIMIQSMHCFGHLFAFELHTDPFVMTLFGNIFFDGMVFGSLYAVAPNLKLRIQKYIGAVCWGFLDTRIIIVWLLSQ